ncbi:MAG: hypothetical protein ACRDX8_02875 [Acidimicrobiales bacterium]
MAAGPAPSPAVSWHPLDGGSPVAICGQQPVPGAGAGHGLLGRLGTTSLLGALVTRLIR